MRRMKTISFGRSDLIHVETDLGIVKIHRVHYSGGQRVERIEILPNRYAGEPAVWIDGEPDTARTVRFIEQTRGDE